MPIIDPCSKCGKPVSHETNDYPHNIICEECKDAEVRPDGPDRGEKGGLIGQGEY